MPSKKSSRSSRRSKGQILRRSYTRDDGTYVRSSCVPDKGSKGRGKKVLPQPRKETALGKYGYGNVKSMSAASRRVALTKAVKSTSYSEVIRRLNLIANFNKNNPAFHKILRSDMQWIRNNLSEYSASGASSSKKTSKRKSSKKVSKRKSSKKSKKVSKRKSSKKSKKVSKKSSKKLSKKSKKVSKRKWYE